MQYKFNKAIRYSHFNTYKTDILKDKRSHKLNFDSDGRYHYVYRISCKETGRHYYGCRTSEVHPSKDLGVVYFSSSLNEDFKSDVMSNPQNYKFKVVKILNSPSDKIIFEAFLHQRFDVKKNTKFLNRANQTPFGFDQSGTKQSEESNRKRSESLKRKTHSEEYRRKMSELRKGKSKSKEHRKRIGEALKGKITH